MLQVVEAVKRISGRDFPARLAERRPGDPPEIVANSTKIRDALGWRPQLDDLDTIVRHALAWERKSDALKAGSAVG